MISPSDLGRNRNIMRRSEIMSFTEWYKETFNDEWTENHAPLMSLLDDYEEWCKKNNVTPIWNG